MEAWYARHEHSSPIDSRERTHAMTEGQRTRRLAALQEEYRRKAEEVRTDGDLTPDAKSRRLAALESELGPRLEEERRRVMEDLDGEREERYRGIHGPDSPLADPRADTARELRLARIRAELEDEFSRGMLDPLLAYQEAVRLGDRDRAQTIAKVGPKHLKDPSRKWRLGELVAEQEPPERKKAREELARLEQERFELDTAFEMQRRAAPGR